MRSAESSESISWRVQWWSCFLPEVREFIKDTKPKIKTTEGGRKARIRAWFFAPQTSARSAPCAHQHRSPSPRLGRVRPRLPWWRGACAVTRCTRRKAAAAATTIRGLTAAIATTAAPASCGLVALQGSASNPHPVLRAPPRSAAIPCAHRLQEPRRMPAAAGYSAAHPAARRPGGGDEALPKGGARRGRGRTACRRSRGRGAATRRRRGRASVSEASPMRPALPQRDGPEAGPWLPPPACPACCKCPGGESGGTKGQGPRLAEASGPPAACPGGERVALADGRATSLAARRRARRAGHTRCGWAIHRQHRAALRHAPRAANPNPNPSPDPNPTPTLTLTLPPTPNLTLP